MVFLLETLKIQEILESPRMWKNKANLFLLREEFEGSRLMVHIVLGAVSCSVQQFPAVNNKGK